MHVAALLCRVAYIIKTNSREKFPRIASGLLFWKSSQVMKESRNCCINLQYKSIYK